MVFDFKKENKEKCSLILIIVLSLAAMSLLFYLIKQGVFLFVERTNFSDRMVSMGAMILLSTMLVIAANKFGWELSVFPKRFSKWYITANVIAGAIFILMPSNYTEGWQSVLILIYGSIITPIFEELIFRGLVWNKLKEIFKSEWTVYVIDTILFGLWHLVYVDSIAFRMQDGLANVMFWKVITGLCFGVVLGIVRKYAKNCYVTMLLHGVMNAVGK